MLTKPPLVTLACRDRRRAVYGFVRLRDLHGERSGADAIVVKAADLQDCRRSSTWKRRRRHTTVPVPPLPGAALVIGGEIAADDGAEDFVVASRSWRWDRCCTTGRRW